MKRSFNLLCQVITSMKMMLLTAAIISINGVYAQEKQTITGRLVEDKGNQPVPFATVSLNKVSDLTIAGGAMSDENGIFNITPVLSGEYILKVSNIGFKPVTKRIEVLNTGVTDAGIITLQDTTIMLKELVIVGERIKAKSESDRTSFLVTKKMLDASSTGVDLLKFVPGIQIDLMQNISLEGSQDILIYVDGKERDRSYVAQLNPRQIDRIEILSSPPSNYDGNLTGAINIVMKEDREAGVNGQILAEVPISFSEVFISPAYSLNYGFKKLNLYTSYNGEMTYLDIHESTCRRVLNDTEITEITSDQSVRQKDWSHRFHYGFDYFLSAHDQFNFYAFYNPYSREMDGTAESQVTGDSDSYWQAKKEDTDINTGTFYSLYYKHSFDKTGSEITADLSSNFLNAENKTEYIYEGSGNDMVVHTNNVKPKQRTTSIKIDYTALLSGKVNFSTGVKARLQVLQDRLSDFDYNENIFALYGNFAYKQEKFDLGMGLRAEKSLAALKDNFSNPVLVFLPYTNFRYKLSSRQNIQLSYNRSVKRPNIYQLNPYTAITDPYSVSSGNPLLRPELLGSIYLEHSVQFNGNYFASRIFHNRTSDVINNLTFINDTSAFETQVHNLGTISQYGLQFSGTLKLGAVVFNPYIKLFSLYTSGNNLANYYSIEDKRNPGLESGLSAIVSFKHDLAFSFTCQYNSPKDDIQGNSFSDFLYFMSMEKTFKQKIKIGIMSAIPFTKSFTYQGSDIDAPDFHSHYEGNVKLSGIPFWLKLSYQFSSGKNRDKITRDKEEIDNLPKKGF